MTRRGTWVGELHVVVGGQFGSEGKGHVTSRLVRQAVSRDRQTLNVRVGGPNAGHTVVDAAGRHWPLRQVPVGAVDPGVQLYIAPGSEIDPHVLLAEIDRLVAGGHQVSGRLYVSVEATVLTQSHKDVESELVGEIGSTGKGIGAARADRIMRKALRVMDDVELMHELSRRGVLLHTPNKWLPGLDDTQIGTVVVEGTQGYGLGLRAGMYPYSTSADCRAIDFLSQAGINPWDSWFRRGEPAVWVVVRPFPIRVAGNSGPLRGETTWDYLGLPQELTTVTQKVRRVGDWDGTLVRRAVMANGGGPGMARGSKSVRLALTMADHVAPAIAGVNLTEEYYHRAAGSRTDGFEALDKFISMVEADAGAPVSMVTTGPDTGFFR